MGRSGNRKQRQQLCLIGRAGPRLGSTCRAQLACLSQFVRVCVRRSENHTLSSVRHGHHREIILLPIKGIDWHWPLYLHNMNATTGKREILVTFCNWYENDWKIIVSLVQKKYFVFCRGTVQYRTCAYGVICTFTRSIPTKQWAELPPIKLAYFSQRLPHTFFK